MDYYEEELQKNEKAKLKYYKQAKELEKKVSIAYLKCDERVNEFRNRLENYFMILG